MPYSSAPSNSSDDEYKEDHHQPTTTHNTDNKNDDENKSLLPFLKFSTMTGKSAELRAKAAGKAAAKAGEYATSKVPLTPMQKKSLKLANKVLRPQMPEEYMEGNGERGGEGASGSTANLLGGSGTRSTLYIPKAALPPSAYPVQGIYFFLRHPSLWGNLCCPLFLFFLISVGMLVFIFAYIFPVQQQALFEGTSLNDAGAWAVSFFLSLIYVVLVTLLAFVILLPAFQEKTFNDVVCIKARGYQPPPWAPESKKSKKQRSKATINTQPTVNKNSNSGAASSGLDGKTATHSTIKTDPHATTRAPYNILYDRIIARPDNPFGSKAFGMCLSGTWASIMVSVFLRLFFVIITFPINAIPVVGTGMWLYINGLILAWEHMITYLGLRNLTFSQQRVLVMGKHRIEYVGFGLPAMGLLLVPGFNWIFAFTNVAGAALWAWDAEEEDIKRWIKKNGSGEITEGQPIRIQDPAQEAALRGGSSTRRKK